MVYKQLHDLNDNIIWVDISQVRAFGIIDDEYRPDLQKFVGKTYIETYNMSENDIPYIIKEDAQTVYQAISDHTYIDEILHGKALS